MIVCTDQDGLVNGVGGFARFSICRPLALLSMQWRFGKASRIMEFNNADMEKTYYKVFNFWLATEPMLLSV